MHIIDKVLTHQVFKQKPLVFLDIGASGTIHKKWKRISKYAVCIAFDADTRDFNPSPEISKRYHKLHVINAIVSTTSSDGIDFHLTKSPYCSSTLQPSSDQLKDWAFGSLFEVEQSIKLKAVDLTSVLKSLQIDYIDWYKSDSQGTDLRLFASLNPAIHDSILVSEFEPGIMDAYRGEDKLHAMLSYMDSTKKFWLANLKVKGTMRLPHARLPEIFKNSLLQRLVTEVGPKAPGWGEMTYINTFRNDTSLRRLLAGWVFATLLGHHGFAYELARTGSATHGEKLFDELSGYSRSGIRGSIFNSRYFSILREKLGGKG